MARSLKKNKGKKHTSQKRNHGKENPFENIRQRRKFDLLGVKKQEIHLSKQHSKQIEVRKETLLKDFYKRQDFDVETEFNKPTSKFTQNRMKERANNQSKSRIGKKRKRSKFNLEDDDEQDTGDDSFNSKNYSHKSRGKKKNEIGLNRKDNQFEKIFTSNDNDDDDNDDDNDDDDNNDDNNDNKDNDDNSDNSDSDGDENVDHDIENNIEQNKEINDVPVDVSNEYDEDDGDDFINDKKSQMESNYDNENEFINHEQDEDQYDGDDNEDIESDDNEYVDQRRYSGHHVPTLNQEELFVNALQTMQNQLKQQNFEYSRAVLEDLDHGKSVSVPNIPHGYPSISHLQFAKFIADIYPVGVESVNNMTTPASLYIHYCLSSCPILSYRDICCGLFTCSTAYHYVNESKRMSPESISFLFNIISYAIPDAKIEEFSTVLSISTSRKDWLLFDSGDFDGVKDIPEQISNKYLENSCHISQGEEITILKATILIVTLNLVKQFCGVYSRGNIVSLPEVFDPIINLLRLLNERITNQEGTSKLLARVKETLEYVERQVRLIKEGRKPLDYMVAKPQEIQMLEPLLYNERVIMKGRVRDTNEERLQHRLLKKKIKRETKAASRELKRDNRFMRKAREEEQRRGDYERKEKYKHIMKTLQDEKSQALQVDNTKYKMQREVKQARKKRKKGRN